MKYQPTNEMVHGIFHDILKFMSTSKLSWTENWENKKIVSDESNIESYLFSLAWKKKN